MLGTDEIGIICLTAVRNSVETCLPHASLGTGRYSPSLLVKRGLGVSFKI